MKKRYVTVKCPSCMSASQVKAKSLRTVKFFCPVCAEGIIEHRIRQPRTYRDEIGSPIEKRTLVTV